MITETQAKALRIIIDHPTTSAAGFARFLWPDNEVMHRKKPWFNGGNYTGKLEKAGLIRKSGMWGHGQSRMYLTKKGEEALAEYDNHFIQIATF